MNDKRYDLICNGVKKRLGKEPWFGGVCLDGITDDMTLEEAVEHAVDETIYWDGGKN